MIYLLDIHVQSSASAIEALGMHFGQPEKASKIIHSQSSMQMIITDMRLFRLFITQLHKLRMWK